MKLKNKVILSLVILTLVLLFFLPNHPIDPWKLFNPRLFGVLIITIAGIQFFGYVAIYIFGQYLGIAITGFLGGFISSTAVYANLAHALHHFPLQKKSILASALLSNVAMLIAILIILLIASHTFFLVFIWPIASMIFVATAMALYLLISNKKANHIGEQKAPTFDLVSVLYTAVLISAILILIAIIKRYIGVDGFLLASFLSGLFEVHGITLATAVLYVNNQINIQDASYALALAILASFLSKIGLLWSLTPKRFAGEASLYLIGIILTASIVYWATGT